MTDLISDLEMKGWIIEKVEGLGVFAKRIETGKLAFFMRNDNLNTLNLMRVWNKGYHPFSYKIERNQIIYYDCLFDEFIKNP